MSSINSNNNKIKLLKGESIYSSLSDQNKLFLETVSSKYKFSYQELRQLSVISADFSMWKSKSVRDYIIEIESENAAGLHKNCLLYTSPSPRDGLLSRMPSSA